MKKLICISCPMGCHLTVDDSNLQNIKVSGNTCPRGVVYATNEVTCPKRMVTVSVRVDGGVENMCSVKTKDAIAKDLIFDCIAALKQVTLVAPVAIGDVVLSNVCGSGVDVIATKSVAKK